MPNYDFHIFQPAEFEVFSRDILQAREGLFVESFADGRDKGIDCRFAYSKDKTAIIQCKRYAAWDSLKSKLSEESDKVKKLNPDRYILTTSVDLTAENKKKIRELFGKYIKADTDILGKADLNNLLSLYPEIETKHYKLWMSSTTVLTHILHNEVIGWSNMSLDQIRDELAKYVENKSFADAVNIIKENKVVIISGEPGIGKTTLARMLVIYLMKREGYSNYTYITDNLSEALRVEKKGEQEKQVVFFDDFLGKNVLESKDEAFFRKVSLFANDAKKCGRVLIMTTREYIFREAKNKYDRTVLENLEAKKYILEMGDYNDYVKSQIIYNHFAAAELPIEYAKQLRDNRNYYNLVSHKNFNPRLIETVVKEKIWEHCTSEEFYPKLKVFFDNPIAVWDEAFSNLSKEAQYSLYVLATMPTPVLLDDWKLAYFQFQSGTMDKYKLQADEDDWFNIIRTLEQCFVRTKSLKDRSVVDFANPSVFDYLANHLKVRPIICRDLISNVYFYEQLFHLFRDTNEQKYYSRVVVGEECYDLILSSFKNAAIQNQRVCELRRHTGTNLKKTSFSIIEAYSLFLSSYSKVNASRDYFVETNLDFDTLTNVSRVEDSLKLLEQLNKSKCSFDFTKVMDELQTELQFSGDIFEFVHTAKNIGCEELLYDEIFISQVDDIINEEVDNAWDYQSCEDLLDTVNFLSIELDGWNYCNYQEELKKKRDEYEEEIDEDTYRDMTYRYEGIERDYYSKMDEMFDCLCSKEID